MKALFQEEQPSLQKTQKKEEALLRKEQLMLETVITAKFSVLQEYEASHTGASKKGMQWLNTWRRDRILLTLMQMRCTDKLRS